MTPAAPTSPARKARPTRLGQIVFTVHQWLGLAAGLVLVVVALSGAILTFAPEIRVWAYHQTVVPEEREFAEVTAFRDTLSREFPAGDFRTITFRGRARAVEVLLFAPGTFYLAQLNPYSAELIHLQNMGTGFIQRVLGLHRNLLLKNPGRQVVHWATLIFGGLVLSGIALRSGRQRWRGLAGWHVLVGYYGSVLAIGSIVTGLYWGFGGVNDGVKWVTGEAEQRYDEPKSVVALPALGGRGPAWPLMQNLATAFRQDWPDRWIRVSLPHRPEEPIRVAVISPQHTEGGVDVHYFDRYTGVRLEGKFERAMAAELSLFQQVNLWVYRIHFGEWGGYAGRLLTGLSSLAVTTLPITGFWLFARRWWRRKRIG
jgi:uncharacterized iron-regulated membrane protein